MSDSRFFLNPHSIRALVPEPTFERGMSLYLIQQVLSCEVNHVNSTEWEIDGLVQGTLKTPYQVTATVEIDPAGNLSFFNSECTCPVGEECKHGVAMTLKAAFKSIKPDINRPSSMVARGAVMPLAATPLSAQEQAARLQVRERAMAEREALQAHQKVTQWLDLFDQLPAPLDATGLDGDSPDAVRKSEQLVFVLTTSTTANQQFLHLGYGIVTRLRNGSWSKMKTPRYGDIKYATAQDQEVLSLLRNMGGHGMSYSYAVVDSAQLSGETGRLAMQMAVKSARLYDQSTSRTLDHPLRLGPPRALAWNWVQTTIPGAQEPGWALQASLDGHGDDKGDGDSGTLARPAWFANSPPWYLDSKLGECGVIEMPGLSAEHLALLLKAPPIPQSDFATHETALLSRLVGLPLPPVLKAPRVIQGVAPRAILEIEPTPLRERKQAGLLCATLRFQYGEVGIFSRSFQTPVFVERSLEGGKASERVMLHRDVARERSALLRLQDFGLRGNADGLFHMALAQDQYLWLKWSESEFELLRDAGFTVVLAPEMQGWIERADSLDVSMNEPQSSEAGDEGDVGTSQSPWFDLSLGMQINGQRHNILPFLPELLSQLGNFITEDGHIAQLPPFAYLAQPSGKLLRLPTEPLLPWLNALLDLLGERGHDLSGGTLRLSRMEAMRLGAALGAGVHWNGAQALREMVKQLAGQSALAEVALPTGLNAELRPYQHQGLNWLQFLRTHGLGGILADDMGLGKTLQTLAHVLVEKQAGRLDRPALVIAPVSLMGNWRREANRFTPTLRVLVLHGAERHEAATDMATHDLIIAPYSLLKRDRERWMNQPWHIVVLDEAQNIKNANTDAAQVVAELNTRHRLCLSGTPMENHLGELWSLFHFLMPGFLGSQARFKELFRTPIEKLGSSERLDQLRRRVTPFMLRRAKSDVATDLPPKQTADLYETIRLTTEKAVREALANKGLAKSQIQILDALLKLRQVCCDPRLVPLPAAKKIKESAKLELLMELLPEMLAEGRRILLFSQFTSMLELIEEELHKRKLSWVKLTGQSQKRDALIEQFTSGQVPLFLISLKAGGVGLNLPQADTVIHYDPWWNPAVENQATDRAHRIGQTQSVFVYKLVAQGTIEERILALQERKAALADSIYSGSQGRKQPLFTEDDVAELLKPLGQ
jgi:superfamily II DNA or RNA helicase